MADTQQVADAFIDAYNRFDLETIEELLDDQVELVHYNRGFSTSGKEDTMALYRGAPELMPDRQFTDRKGITIDGNVAIIRHVLTATPTTDMPFGPADEPLYFHITSIITVSDDGKVLRYEDYG